MCYDAQLGELQHPSSVVLIGCVETKSTAPALAKDLYSGPVFARRLAYAEASGRPWFVISSRWGLTRPDELIAPYEMSLAAQSPMFRRAWGRLVAEQLAAAFPLERGTLVEVHADDAYLDSLRSSLEYLELVVIGGVDSGSFSTPIAR